MYPISAEKRLSFLEIADHWAGELGQPNRYHQLLEDLIRGWWSGRIWPSRGGTSSPDAQVALHAPSE